ncbi:MAG: hypothetical protein QJR07_10280 [Acetobacteraceae bacterium]|nr:hypothetical protein [Acetobacteraceae bacterium]
MTWDILGNAAAGAAFAKERPASEAAQGVGVERLLLAALPEGWSVVGQCRFGTALPGPTATGCHALAHPAVGIALIDIAPDATPNAESRLRRALNAADFWSDFPGYLPVWHGRLEGPAIRGLAEIVQDRFSALPPLTVPGGQGWISAVRRALAQDAAWVVPGQTSSPATPSPFPPVPEEADEEPRRGRMRALLLLGFLGTFGLGMATGLLLLPKPEPAPLSAAPITPERAVLADPAPAAVTGSVAEQSAAADAAPASPADTAAAEPTSPPPAEPAVEPEPEQEPAKPMATVAAPALPEPAPDTPAEAEVRATMPEDEEAPAPTEEASEPELPPAPPPEPPVPAPRRVTGAAIRPARSASSIDRACIQTLFRFQQGETLSAAEQVHLREGCATRR